MVLKRGVLSLHLFLTLSKHLGERYASLFLLYCDATYLIFIIFIQPTISRLQWTFLFNPASCWPEVTLVDHRLGRPYTTGRVRWFRFIGSARNGCRSHFSRSDGKWKWVAYHRVCWFRLNFLFSIISKKGLRAHFPRFERKRKWAKEDMFLPCCRFKDFSPFCSMPEIIDPVFVKTSPKRSFSITEYERRGLVFTKTRVYKFGHRIVHTLSRLFSTGCTLWDCSLRQLKYFITRTISLLHLQYSMPLTFTL